jgi:hypothetical protein
MVHTRKLYKRRSNKRRRTNANRKQSGGFRYGHGKKHTPSPGDVLINSPRTRKHSNKNKNSWF